MEKMTNSEIRERVRELVRDLGPSGAGRVLGLARQTTLSLAADARVNMGTLAQARAALVELNVENC